MFGLFLSLFVFSNANFSWKEPKLFYDAYLYEKQSSIVFYGVLEENSTGGIVLSHMPVGKYKDAIVYKHELMFKKQDHKVVAYDHVEKTVKIAGQIVAIQGKQYILVESLIILDFNNK
jgi:hypothetical protein